MNEVLVKCHGCERPIVEVSERDASGTATACRERPWWCVVISRRRECVEARGMKLPDGSELFFNEYPNACSVACVRTVAAAWPRLELHEDWTHGPTTLEIEGETVSIGSSPKLVYPDPPAEISDLWQATR